MKFLTAALDGKKVYWTEKTLFQVQTGKGKKGRYTKEDD